MFSRSSRTGLNMPSHTQPNGQALSKCAFWSVFACSREQETQAGGTQPSVAGPADTGLLSSVPAGTFTEQLSWRPVPFPLRALRGSVSSPSHTVQRKQSESVLCPLHAVTVPQACPWEGRAGQLTVTRYDGMTGFLQLLGGGESW